MVEFNSECEQQTIHEGSLYLHAQICLMLIRQNAGRGCNSFQHFLFYISPLQLGLLHTYLPKYFPLMSFLRWKIYSLYKLPSQTSQKIKFTLSFLNRPKHREKNYSLHISISLLQIRQLSCANERFSWSFPCSINTSWAVALRTALGAPVQVRLSFLFLIPACLSCSDKGICERKKWAGRPLGLIFNTKVQLMLLRARAKVLPFRGLYSYG